MNIKGIIYINRASRQIHSRRNRFAFTQCPAKQKPCDIFVPGVIAGIFTGGIGAAAVAGTEVYRAYTFEKNFWINKIVYELSKGNSTISDPKVVEPSQQDK